MLHLVADRLTTAHLHREIDVNQRVLGRVLLQPIGAVEPGFYEALTDEIDRLMLLYSLREAWRRQSVVDLHRWTYGVLDQSDKRESA